MSVFEKKNNAGVPAVCAITLDYENDFQYHIVDTSLIQKTFMGELHMSSFKKRLALASALLACTALAAACGTSSQSQATPPAQSSTTAPGSPAGAPETVKPAEPRVVKDTLGNEVKIPASPKRILGSYLEDPLLVLGEKPVAQWSVKAGTQMYLEKELAGVPIIPSTLPPETVLGFNPDLMLIFSEGTVANGLYDQYAKIAPTYVLGTEVTNDWRKTLRTIADLLNKKDVAEKALKDYDAKVKSLQEKIKPVIGDKKAAILWITNKTFYVVNGQVASGAVLYGDLGLKAPNILAVLPDANANWVSISLEKLAELDADYIFLVNSDKGQPGNLEEPLWKNIPAVKNNRVYEFDRSSSWLYNGLIASSKVLDDVERSLLK